MTKFYEVLHTEVHGGINVFNGQGHVILSAEDTDDIIVTADEARSLGVLLIEASRNLRNRTSGGSAR